MTAPTRLTMLETKGLIINSIKLEKAVDYALSEADKDAYLIKASMSAASKTLTLGLAENQMVIVKNIGATNAFTVKNISTDTGTSLAAGKSILIIASGTKDTSTVIALD